LRFRRFLVRHVYVQYTKMLREELEGLDGGVEKHQGSLGCRCRLGRAGKALRPTCTWSRPSCPPTRRAWQARRGG
jgi:hypothetical protein